MSSFKFIPGAIYGLDHYGLGVYVRYGRPLNFPQDKIEVVEQSGWHLWIKTPDRELLLVRDSYKAQQWRPLDCNFDEYYSFSTGHSTANDFPSEWYMINYHSHLPPKAPQCNFDLHRRLPTSKRRFRIMADSGGFQMLSNRIDFLNPREIATWYANNVDVGMAMDIPLPFVDDDMLQRAAIVQRNNTTHMHSVLDDLHSDVEIMNVTHGMTFEAHKRFLSVVQTDRCQRLALGGVYRHSIVQTLDNTTRLLDYTMATHNHFHLLGIYNLGLMPSMVLLSKIKNVPLMTSDASTPLQSALGRMYHHQRFPDRPMERMIIGTKGTDAFRSASNPHKHLPCSCPVCSRLKYFDIFSLLNGATVYFLLMMHNVFEIGRYTNYMQDMAHQLDIKDYKQLVFSQLENHKAVRHDAMKSLDYLIELQQSDQPTARHKSRAYMEDVGLFTATPMQPTEIFVNLDTRDTQIDYDIEEQRQRLNGIITKYEKWQRREIEVAHGVNLKTKVKKNKKTMFSKRKRLAGEKVKTHVEKRKTKETRLRKINLTKK